MLKKILIISLCSLFFIASFKAFGAINKYDVPLVKSGEDVYISAVFSLLDSSNGSGPYKTALLFNDSFLETAKTGSFDEVKSLFAKRDGSQEKFEQFRKLFSQLNFYKTIDSIKYKDVIVWGDYCFVSVDYVADGIERKLREDLFCQSGSKCKKTIRDFGQPFEIAYLKFIQKRQNESKLKKGLNVVNRSTSQSFDRKKKFNVPLLDSSGNFEKNTFKVTIAVKKLKSDVCIDCESSKHGVLKSEEFLLKQLVGFVNGLADLDFSNYESLLSYITKFDENHKEATAFPMVKWNEGMAETIYSDVRGYLSRINQWQGGVPLGYIKSEEGVYLFIQFDDGSSEKRFDMEVFFLEKSLTEQYKFRPSGNEGSLEQTLIRDPFILNSLKKLFLDQ